MTHRKNRELRAELETAAARIARLERLGAAANAQADLFAERVKVATARAEAAERAHKEHADESQRRGYALKRAQDEAASLRAQRDSLVDDIGHADKAVADLRVSLKATEDNYHELTLEAASLRAQNQSLHAQCEGLGNMVADARKEAAALRAEVAKQFRIGEEQARALASAESRLDAATALLPSAWEAMGELTSFLVGGEHMVRVDEVRGVFERFSSTPTPSERAIGGLGGGHGVGAAVAFKLDAAHARVEAAHDLEAALAPQP